MPSPKSDSPSRAEKVRFPDDAIADFRQAIRAACDSRTLGLVHYNLALAHLARGDHEAALASAHEAAARGYDGARVLSDRLQREH
jgi:hypothetical protein